MQSQPAFRSTVPFADQERGPVVMPWWLQLLLGLFTLLFGVLMLVVPRSMPQVMAHLLGLYWLATGILLFVGLAIDQSHWAWKTAGGILGILAGLLILNHPVWSGGMDPALAALVIGAAGVGVGIACLVVGLRRPDWGMGAAGILDIILGVLVLMANQSAAASSPVFVGTVMVTGAMVIIIRSFI